MPGVLVILDSVAAAQGWLAQGTRASDAQVLSTHYSVVGYLRARGVACQDAMDFISEEEAGVAIRGASAELDRRFTGLDETVGSEACAAGGLPRLALFHSAFKYLGQYNLAGMRSFKRVLSRRLASGGATAIEYYHSLATSVDPVFSFVEAARRVSRRQGVDFVAIAVVPSADTVRKNKLRRVWRLALRSLQAPGKALALISRRLRRLQPQAISADVPVILLFDPQHGSFFESALSGCGLQRVNIPDDGFALGRERFGEAARVAANRMRAVLESWLRAAPRDEDNELDRLCVEHIARSASELLEPLTHTHQLLKSQPVVAAAWDTPLITRPQLNMVAELILNSGVPVLGHQHGANYADQKLGAIHFDSDFNRCTHYFSYGFGPHEFAAAYPGARHRCSFTPAGNPPRARASRLAPVDIVFPITNCVPLYYLARVPETVLVRRQGAILEAMEARHDLQCVVKPPPGFAANSFAHVETLASLKHVRIARQAWTDYLAGWQPRLVVFETASTPLFEVLHLDVDIFLMLDPLFPFTDSALEMLRKRVHIFDSLEALGNAIRRYGFDPLPRLRDASYYDTYVNRGTASAVADLVTAPDFTLSCKPAS